MSKSKMFSQEDQPLTPAVFYILLSLSIKDRHGYDIMKNVEESSKGKIKLGPGTLYGNIKRLLKERLIIETGGDERRRYYKLTPEGKKMVVYELERFEDAINVAKAARLNLGLSFSI